MAVKHRLSSAFPEEQGVSSAGILHFIEAVEKKGLELHSLMLLRHGVIVAQGWWAPYAAELPHMLFSLSKSFTSSAVGLAVAEGLLTVDDPVISFFPDQLPKDVSDHLARMQVRHLLTMSTGHAEDTTGKIRQAQDGDWVKAFLSVPVENPPGAPFVYNSGATYMLSAIVQKLTGMSLLDYLRPRLFEPLGIENPTWESCPRGINTGGWGLSVRTEDIARFGQMYLQKGVWEGKRILPEGWVEAASRKQVSNGDNAKSDWAQGYGYQFWRCRHHAYRGDGAFGQYCLVMPEQDAVLAITSGLGDMQAVLNLVWRHLLPAMRPGSLRTNRAVQARLAQKLGGLRLDPPAGLVETPAAQAVSGVEYSFEPNEANLSSARLDFEGGKCIFTYTGATGTARVTCGSENWLLGETALFNMFGESRPVAAHFAWIANDHLLLTLRFYTTPFCWTISARFGEDQLKLDVQTNVSFGPLQLPSLVGRKVGA